MTSSQLFWMLPLWLVVSALTPPSAEAAVKTAVVRVHPTRALGKVNTAVLGNNVVAYKSDQDPRYGLFGAGLWDPTHNNSNTAMTDVIRDVVRGTLRWPGGCGVHGFNWKTAVGPLDARAKQRFGLPEFLRIAAELGAEPVITISDYTGEASDAADLVEYLNAPIESNPNGGIAWARLRVADGHPEPYKVRYFEYGNESAHGFHLTAQATSSSSRRYTPEQYSQRYRAYRTAMRSVDQTILLGAVLNDDRTPLLSLWTRSVITKTGDIADYYIHHAYLPAYSEQADDVSASALFQIAFAGPRQFSAVFQAINEFVSRTTNRHIPLAVTEFNGSFVQDRPVPYRFTLGNALVVADLLQVLLTPSNKILHSQYWQLANEYWGMIKGTGSPYGLRPAYHVFRLYAKHLGTDVLQTDVTVDGYEQPGGYGVVPARGVGSPFRLIGVSGLLPPTWEISNNLGASATIDTQGILGVEVASDFDLNYYHARLRTKVEPNSGYRITAEIKAEGLTKAGAQLAVGDTRGWKTTRSTTMSEMVHQSTWTPVVADYFTLPDTKEIDITARRLGRSPERGRFWIRYVRMQKFQPFVLPQVPYVGALSTRDGDRVAVFLINRHVRDPVSVRIVAPRAHTPIAWTLSGPSVDATNEQDPDSVTVRPLLATSEQTGIDATLPPHSLSVIEFHVRDDAK